MQGSRTLVLLCLSAALAAFTYGCSSDGGSGGTGGGGTGGGGTGGDAGSPGDGGSGGGGMGGMGGSGAIVGNFETSLHKTRAGKEFWYRSENMGMEILTGVDYNDFACKDCHDKAANPDWTEATCGDCHGEGDEHLQSETCLGCHGRQRAEIGMIQGMDFHTQMGVDGPEYTCASCHKSNDVHGNGTAYDTMLRPGAIAVSCTDCHGEGVDGAPPPPSDSYHSALHANVDCSLCHTETVISCINCHVEEDLDRGEKCQTGPVFNWKFVMKWDRGGDAPVYHPATLMTLKYNCDRDGDPGQCLDDGDDKKTFAVLAPFYAHTVTQQAIDNITDTPGVPGAPGPGSSDGCAYCHSTANCDTIGDAGGMNDKQKLIEWNGTGLSNPISGLIPLPADYAERFEVDYAEFEAGPGTGCPTPGSPKPLVFFETGPDMWQTGEDTATDPATMEVGHPLTESEMRKFCPDYSEINP